jgi:hypothetical protein
LFETRRLDSGVFDSEGASDFGGSSSVDHTIITDQVADNAEGIV